MLKMREFMKEEMQQMEVVTAKIFKSIEILRKENFTSEENYVILFLLVFYKNLLNASEVSSKFQLMQIIRLSQFNNPNHKYFSQFIQMCSYFEPQIEKLSDDGLKELLAVLSEIDKNHLSENFKNIYDNIFQLISLSQGRFSDNTLLPNELIHLIWNLAEPSPNAKIFNPFARFACLGVSLPEYQNYYGQEGNLKTWALGFLRFLAYGKKDFTNFKLENSLQSWPDPSEKFDFIISVPPFGMRLVNHYTDFDLNNRTVEQFLIEKGIKSLSQNGKLIALLPQGFLFKGSHDQRLRQHLIEEDLIDTVISLPGGLLQNTSIPLTILVLSKAKKLPGRVKFVDGTKFEIFKGPRNKVLDGSSLNTFIQSNNFDENIVKIILNEQILSNDFNLSVARYFQKQIDGVRLGDVIELVRGQRSEIPKKGKLIRIRDLKDDKVDFTLDLLSVEETELRRPDIKISESCLLIALRWRTLKPTLFQFKGEPIFRSQDILSFKVNENLVDKAYLINELHAEYVQEQLESYRLGAYVMPIIRKDDLMEVVIKLPSIEEQRAKVKGIYELSDKIKYLQEERNALVHGVTNKLYESVTTIKHSLGKPLLNIGSSLRNIEKALSTFNINWKDVKLNERYDLTIKDSFNSVYSNLELINSMLRNNEEVLDVSNYELKEIDFIVFINSYINRIKSAESSNVNTRLDINPDIKTQLKNKVLIMANAELLEIGLNNIVENANMHAFIDDSKKYVIEFRISLYVASNFKNQFGVSKLGKFDTYLKIDVSNNGKPFPKNYSLEKLIRKNSFAGETGNTGQGGFDLNEIIKYHNNGISTLELITDDFTTEFSTTYSFLIPFNR